MIRITTYFILILTLSISNGFAQKTALKEKLTTQEKLTLLFAQRKSLVNVEAEVLEKELKIIKEQYDHEEITVEQATKLNKDAKKRYYKKIRKLGPINKETLHLIRKSENHFIDYIGTKGSLAVAFGLNGLMTNGALNSLQDSNFDLGKSFFTELGFNLKTRLFRDSDLYFINYGLAFRHNRLRVKDNNYFVATGENTALQTYVDTEGLKRVSFRNSQLVIPLFFELDFSKPKYGTTGLYYPGKKSWRIGIGVFGGINLASNQITVYKKDGELSYIKNKGDFNVNSFIYGLQGEIGYKTLSFYARYELNDLFKQNFTNQKNVSFGVKWDYGFSFRDIN